MEIYASEHLGRLSDRVYGLIKRDILSGRLSPGEHLPLEETAERLGVSTTPVRDAFGLLAADGLVEWRPRHGAFVAQLTPQAIEEAYQVRAFLESCAMEYALQNPAVVAEMQALATQIAAVPVDEARANLHTRANLELRFHALPIESVGNSKLSEMHVSLNGIIVIGSTLYPLTQARGAEVAAEHQAIVDALQQADLDGAQAAVRAHLRNASAHLVQHLPLAEEVV